MSTTDSSPCRYVASSGGRIAQARASAADCAVAGEFSDVPAQTNAETQAHAGARLGLLASIVIAFLAASSAPTPLYQHYDLVFHGTALTSTVAFAFYALAVLVGLLSLGEVARTSVGGR